MHSTYRRLLHCTLLIASANHGFSEEILLRMEAAPDAKIIARVDADAPSIEAAAPVLDTEQAAAGWMWTEYSTEMLGYVKTTDLGKNFNLPPNTLVRAAPDNSSAVLTSAQDGDQFEYVEADTNWATFRFAKPVPVYFQSKDAAALAAASTIATQTAIADAPATTDETSPATDSQLQPADPLSNGHIRVSHGSAPAEQPQPLASLELEQPTVETVEPTQTAPLQPQVDIIAEAPRADTPVAPRRPAPDAITTRILTGKLIRESRQFGPNYPIRLLGASGKQLAYVDMSRIFISDLRPYLNETVYIRGEVRPLVPGSKELIILARTIQLTR